MRDSGSNPQRKHREDLGPRGDEEGEGSTGLLTAAEEETRDAWVEVEGRDGAGDVMLNELEEEEEEEEVREAVETRGVGNADTIFGAVEVEV